MTEESRPKLTLKTQRSSDVNTPSDSSSDNLSEQTSSGAGKAEEHLRGARDSTEHQTMGSSNQPISGNANTTRIGSNAAVQISAGGGGNTRLNSRGDRSAVAGHRSMGRSNRSFSGNGNMSKSETSVANLDNSYPSSLRSSSTCTSYSLEISLSTASEEKEAQPLPLRTTPESRNGRNKQKDPSLHPGDTKRGASLTNSYTSSAPKPLPKRAQPPESMAAKVSQCEDRLGSCQIVTPKTPNAEFNVEKTFSSIPGSTGKLGATPVFVGQPPNSVEPMASFSKEWKSTEDEEDTFYAFVILHAVEDAEEAARLKSRMERISSAAGAVFSEDFAEPGRSTFRCVEDAISNSAYTMLLLTPNYNTLLNEMNTDSALMNSMEKPHKYNTVIPLLPRDNSLAHADLPMILRTKIPMKEQVGKAFEVTVRKVLDPGKIQRQKKIWKEEQLVRKQRERRRQLQDECRRRKDFIQESAKVRDLEQQRMQLLMQQQRLPQPNSYGDFSGEAKCVDTSPPPWQDPLTPQYSGAGWHQTPTSIHIEHAKYIMIGNESTMTVGGAGNSSGDEDCS